MVGWKSEFKERVHYKDKKIVVSYLEQKYRRKLTMKMSVHENEYPKTLYQRRWWHPTPVLLPGKSHGWRSLIGCSPWGLYSQTRLSDFTFTFHFYALEKEMATHSNVLAWRIPGMRGVEGSGGAHGMPSMGSHRVGHDWSDLAAAAAAKHFILHINC